MKRPVISMSPFYEPQMKVLEDSYEVHRAWDAAAFEAAVAAVGARCEVVATTGSRGLSAAEMDRLPALRLVACFGVGVDAIDVEHARRRGVAVTNTPDVLTEDVADLALALLLAQVRRIPYGDRFVREGRWLHGGMPVTPSLQGAKVGIVGLGRIGSAIARRCAAFNTTIGYYGPRRKAESPHRYFDDVVAMAGWADVLVAACPGGAATRHVVSRAALTALGAHGVFVNIARGSVVDQQALVELLGSGALGGAALDVFENEPAVPPVLFGMDNVVLHPHQGSATHGTRHAMGQLVLDNIAAWAAGKPLVTPV